MKSPEPRMDANEREWVVWVPRACGSFADTPMPPRLWFVFSFNAAKAFQRSSRDPRKAKAPFAFIRVHSRFSRFPSPFPGGVD